MSIRVDEMLVRSILPRANNTYDIGSSSLKFNDIYATYFRGALKGNADTATKWANARTLTIGLTGKSIQGDSNVSWTLAEIGALPTSGGTISYSNTTSVGWPLVLHQTGNAQSTGWGPGIKFLNASDSGNKWAGIAGVANSEWANTNNLHFYTSATARYAMNESCLYPLKNNTYACGGMDYRWNNVYTYSINAADSIYANANYALRFGYIDPYTAYLAADANGLFLAVYGSGNSGKTIYLETYDTDIYHRKNGTNYNILTSANYTNWACPNSGSNSYVKVYNSNNVGSSSSVTINGLAKQGFAAAMVHAAEDNPRGGAGWVHALSMAWGAGNNNNWISQLAFGVQDSNGLWYRTNQNNCVGAGWKRVLDSSNYTSYAPTKTGSGASGTWNISITGNAATASSLQYTGSIGSNDTGTYAWRLVARARLTLATYYDADVVIAITQRFYHGRSIVLKASLRAGGSSPGWSLYYENGNDEARYDVSNFQLAIYNDGTYVYGDLFHVSSNSWLRTTTTVLSNINWTIYNSSEGSGATNPVNCYASSSAAASALYGASAYSAICKPSGRTNYYTVNPNDQGWVGFTGQIIYQLID